MNIFVTDRNPVLAAKNLCDKHCVRMITESAQLMCTAHWVGWSRTLDPPPDLRGRRLKEWISERLDDKTRPPYSMTHVNHPCAVWARHCWGNYVWLYNHALGLCEEYTLRYGRVHKTEAVIRWAGRFMPPTFEGDVPINFTGTTPFAIAMPAEFRVEGDAVQSYRNYYNGSKSRFAKWKNGQPPSWWAPHTYQNGGENAAVSEGDAARARVREDSEIFPESDTRIDER